MGREELDLTERGGTLYVAPMTPSHGGSKWQRLWSFQQSTSEHSFWTGSIDLTACFFVKEFVKLRNFELNWY